jgi:ADP-dependent NAD(P)H-hydrate dehydratase / NAD(P)H-hydrate epimerase
MWAPARPVSSEEMAVVERNAVALGLSIDAMMENAGRAVAEEVARRLPPPPSRVAIIASTGNNGGDGTSAAFYLHQWGYSPEVWLVRSPAEIRSRAARRCFERIERQVPMHMKVPRSEELASMPLVVDALLGTGQSERLRGPVKEAVAAIQSSRAPVLSIDLPTGARDPEGLRPSWTVALAAVKQEIDPARAGEVIVRDIGLPAAAWRATGPGEFAFLPLPSGRSERGRTARIIVIGGGPYTGAPALAALAALRSGAERATVVAPGGAAETVRAFSPNLVVQPYGSERFRPIDVPDILEFVRTSHPEAVVVGMGAGAHPETGKALGTVEAELAGTVPLVVDADGLAVLPSAADLAEKTGAPVVATPNAGEFLRIFAGTGSPPTEGRAALVQRLAADRHLVLLVKGDPDLLSDGEQTVENLRHHPAMTVGGVGDVLAGVIGSLLGQGLGALPAGRLAAYWVGEAGILAASRKSFGLLATDVIEELPTALVNGLARSRAAE